MWILYCLCLVASASGQDDVRLPPSITKNPNSTVIFKEFDRVILECRAEGTQPITFEWRQNGNRRSPTSSTSYTSLEASVGDLTIHKATKHDDGFYQCNATNEYGTALSTMAHVQHAFLQQTSPSYVNITVHEGHPFVIHAARRNSFPTPTYIWETVQSDVNTNPRPFKTPWTNQLSQRVRDTWEGDLHFAYALEEDVHNGSTYKSTVLNEFNGARSCESSTRLTVTKSSGSLPDFPPNITYSAKKQKVTLIGDTLELKCFFSGKPLPDITWSRPGKSLPSRPDIIPSTHYNTLLKIYNITESDEGDYVCTASNTMGTASHTFYIRVEAVPVFRRESDGPRNVNVTEGDSVTFNCSAFAKPEATVVWLRNGQPINVTETPRRFVFSNDSKSLTIRDVCRNCADRDNKTDLMVIQCNASNVHGYAFGQGYLNVLMSTTVTLQPYSTIDLTKEKLFQFNCSATSDLSTPANCDGFIDKEFKDLHKMVYSVKGDTLNQTMVADIASQLSALTNKSEGLSPGNLNASVMIINHVAALLRDINITLNETEIESFVQVISNVLQTSNAASWKELEKVDKATATNIWSITDDFGQILATLHMPGHVTVPTDNLVLEAWSTEKSNLPLQIEFSKGSLWGENRGDGISISMETLSSSISSESQRTLNMWGVYYRTMDKILPGKKDGDDVVNSRILSFSIEGLKTNQTLKPPVTITLSHNQEKRRNYRRTCSFWNFNRGDWDSFGCSVTSTNKTHTICSCDHLTNFAILMSINPVKDDLLSLISIIGCSISVASLVLTVIVYAVTWKHAKSSQAALLMNLCIALIIAYIIFMAGADKFDSNLYSLGGCKVVAALLHYFFLVAFFIMFAEGVDMVLYIFFVFHVRRTRETVMLIASAWVLPLIVVGVSLGVTQLEGYGHKEACWLSIDDGLIWAFIGPVMCIIAINLVILIIILRLISQKKALLAGNGKKRDEIRATIWNLSVMCPVLGLGWLFGVFSVSFDHVAFQYVFVIANSLHGMLIFIIYALFHNKKMNEKISSVYSNCIGRCGKTGLSVFTKLSSSQDHSTSSTSNTQLTSDRKKSTSEAAPAYGVIADMTSAQKT